MKKALIVLGGVFLSLIILAIGVMPASYWIMTAAERDGKAYVHRVTPMIVAAWDPNALVGQASQQFLSATPPVHIDPAFIAFSHRLGTLQPYGGGTRGGFVVTFA